MTPPDPSFAANLVQQSDAFLSDRPHLGAPIEQALRLLKRSKSSPGHAIDFACGAGRLSVALAVAYPELRVRGLDLDADAITFARGHALQAGVAERCDFQEWDLAKSRPTGRFDLVCFMAARELFRDDDDMVVLARALTAEGGYWLVDDAWLFSEPEEPALRQRTAEFANRITRIGGKIVDNWKSEVELDYSVQAEDAMAGWPTVEEVVARGQVDWDTAAAARQLLTVSMTASSVATRSVTQLWLIRI